jgi:hypothetical protein
MENKLECRPVLLQSYDGTKGLIKVKDGILSLVPPLMRFYTSEHLYLVSDREIEEGDYIYGYGGISKFGGMLQMYEYLHRYKKVEASTDPSLGRPGVPKEWIEKEYIAKQGKIDKVWLKMSEYTTRWDMGEIGVQAENTTAQAPSTNQRGEVIILSTVEEKKDYLMPGDGDGFGNFLKGNLNLPGKVIVNKPPTKTYTREEVMNIILNWHDDQSTLSIKDWFDSNYPL